MFGAWFRIESPARLPGVAAIGERLTIRGGPFFASPWGYLVPEIAGSGCHRSRPWPRGINANSNSIHIGHRRASVFLGRLGRRAVQADDAFELLGEFRIVRDLEAAHDVQLGAVSVSVPHDGAGGHAQFDNHLAALQCVAASGVVRTRMALEFRIHGVWFQRFCL